MPNAKTLRVWTFAIAVCFILQAARGQALENADIGPVLVNTIQGPDNNTAYKGVVIKLGKAGEAAVCFDAELLRYMGGWVKVDAKPSKSTWTTCDWAGLIDPNHS